MNGKYPYLHPFRFKSHEQRVNSGKPLKVFFLPIEPADILEAEKKMGVPFPRAMREFFSEIGSGILASTVADPYGGSRSTVNRFYSPLEIADMYVKREHLLGGPPLKSDQLPLMELFSGDYVMVLRKEPECPVCIRGTTKRIEDSLERFIHGLAHQGPDYYLMKLYPRGSIKDGGQQKGKVQ